MGRPFSYWMVPPVPLNVMVRDWAWDGTASASANSESASSRFMASPQFECGNARLVAVENPSGASVRDVMRAHAAAVLEAESVIRTWASDALIVCRGKLVKLHERCAAIRNPLDVAMAGVVLADVKITTTICHIHFGPQVWNRRAYLRIAVADVVNRGGGRITQSRRDECQCDCPCDCCLQGVAPLVGFLLPL